MKVSAILFDLDGTLRDTREAIYESVKHAVREVGGPDLQNEDLYDYIQHHSHVHQQFAAHATFEEFDSKFYAELRSRIPQVPLYDGVREVLDELRSHGIKTAIVTSATPADVSVFLDQVGLSGHFEVIVGDDGVMQRKPAADPLLAAAEQLDVRPEDCLMVGDMRVDMQAANAAGAVPVAITHGFETEQTLREYGAQYVIHSLNELPKLVKELS